MRFLELRYISYIKDINQIFDYTEKPVIVPIGKGILYSFLENVLKDAKPGKTYKYVFIKPFGERKQELIKIIPLSEFAKHNIKPFVGLIVNIDGKRGIVRSISGGRVIVDFNHPVAGKDLVYEVEVIREVKDVKDKIIGTLSFLLGVDKERIEASIDTDNKTFSIKIDGKELADSQKDTLSKILGEIDGYKLK